MSLAVTPGVSPTVSPTLFSNVTNSDVVSVVAKERWKILRRAIVEKAKAESQNQEEISIRRFASFNLFVKCDIQRPTLRNDDSGNPSIKGKFVDNEDPSKTVSSSDVRNDTTSVNDNPSHTNTVVADATSWSKYQLLKDDSRDPLKIRLHSKTNVRDLANFGDVDNTGNVCVWPAEEVLAYYLSQRPELVGDRSVLELGGGMTCLAGLVVAKWCRAKSVVLTDGNERAVDNVKEILRANTLREPRTKECKGEAPRIENESVHNLATASPCTARLLRWDAVADQASDLQYSVDVIIAADCLFFDTFRQSLVDAIDFLLTSGGDDDGFVLIFAPRRKSTMQDFVEKAELKGFEVFVEEKYDDEITSRLETLRRKSTEDANFDEDIHYPLLLTLRRRRETDLLIGEVTKKV